MTKDPVKRQANNARYYQNKKARQPQGQQRNQNNNQDDQEFDVKDPFDI